MQRFLQITFLTSGSDTIFLQRDLLHRINQPFLERYLFWRVRKRRRRGEVRIVFDVDDAIFLDKSGRESEALRLKLQYICQNCDLVIAGNEHLANYFSAFAPVKIIPTVIDLDRYKPIGKHNDAPIVIAWTGTSGNLQYLSPLVNVFHRLKQDFHFELLIISDCPPSGAFQDSDLPIVFERWSRKSELNSLAQADIGIMPLSENPWAKGKCGFKLLQYMALEIAAIASPVGVNSLIVEPEVNGVLASTEEEWEQELRRLLRDAEFRKRLGRAGRKTVEESYSLSHWFPVWRSQLIGYQSPDQSE